MAHTIGGVTCLLMHGTPPGLKDVSVATHIPGFDGYIGQNLAKAGGECTINVVNIDSNANITTWIASIEALAGTSVTLTYDSTDWNQSFTSLMVTNVSAPLKTGVIYGGSYKVRCEMDVDCVRYA